MKLGLISGFVAPIIIFLIILAINWSEYTAMTERGVLQESGIRFDLFLKIGSICIIPNLLIFFHFIRKNALYSARGVLTATFVFALTAFGLYYL